MSFPLGARPRPVGARQRGGQPEPKRTWCPARNRKTRSGRNPPTGRPRGWYGRIGANGCADANRPRRDVGAGASATGPRLAIGSTMTVTALSPRGKPAWWTPPPAVGPAGPAHSRVVTAREDPAR